MCKILVIKDIWHYVILTKKYWQLSITYYLYTALHSYCRALVPVLRAQSHRAVQHFHNELNRECIVVTRKGLMLCPYLTPNTFSVAVIKSGLQWLSHSTQISL